MKETRYFYVPDAASATELPADEASHAVRVLRMKPGDEMVLMDGVGTFFKAEVAVASPHHCVYRVVEEMPQLPQWHGRYHIAMAPTKLMDRTEWMLEKVTEIGVDEVSLLNCDNSERRVAKPARLEKILVSAMKQSRKAWKPVLNDMAAFRKFVSEPRGGMKFIAHCYEEIPRTYLYDELCGRDVSEAVTVLIGPEGDFTPDEVRMAVDAGYVPVHLGQSRLRTETAAMVAVMMMHLSAGE
ncbi:16S rRNA (uracil(1498)-N(3))-methyltransferase [Marseilla massiliensis]|jgi:16S rRNA (uracil1498-N3)-methyltransferase|uniref:Ribosomal RNA small subunit methyltransferase E n=1 Tax=Marseilla massiliensis TaxID=1841864 RepID=A0A938WMA0_9BACT|nr:16S rRNA (uracil(1498)-N(3))-methyltransferase [Marseilla massiliensis]MBM6661860.1 16S rRNA (uracil(1498)-N(3))-methyltransferase [Marseilla massiliensis]